MNQIFNSGSIKRLEMNINCSTLPGNQSPSFLGTLINFDVENTINENLDAFSVGLNNLGNGQLINNLAMSGLRVTMDLMNN